MEHDLKCWPEYFNAIMEGRKDFELRKDDRPFNVGDTLVLHEYSPSSPRGYTGHRIERIVKYILRDASQFGLQPGYCIMGLKTDII